MKSFMGLTRRNILIFFKDKQSVFFSLLTSTIVLVLYLLFLKGTFVDGINSAIGKYPEISDLIKDSDTDMFANLILLTGIIGCAMITVPYNCLTTVVRDRENRIDYDILATPIRRWKIILSYFVSASVSSIILNTVILTLGIVVLNVMGDTHMSAPAVISAYGIVSLGSISATSLFLVLIPLFKTSSASGAFFGILSAAAGFVIGAYIPISQFSDGVQTVCNIFPASHITSMLRNSLLGGVMDSMDASLCGIDNGQFTAFISELFSFKAHMFGKGLEISRMLIYVLVILAVTTVGWMIIYSKTYKKK